MKPCVVQAKPWRVALLFAIGTLASHAADNIQNGYELYKLALPCAFLLAHLFRKAADNAFLQAALLCFFGAPFCLPIRLATPARILASPWALSFLRFRLLGPLFAA
ncbi:MAG TPA: hypothetical protein VN578_11680 [Candidatus Binatia bacterium]|nr:hypothetical protein [Candidatus Binatia bacterium]